MRKLDDVYVGPAPRCISVMKHFVRWLLDRGDEPAEVIAALLLMAVSFGVAAGEDRGSIIRALNKTLDASEGAEETA